MSPDNGRFQYAVTVVLDHEGGYSDNKNDAGGVTNWGVSLRYLQQANIDPNGDGLINAHDVRGMTKQEATDIYKKQFWDKYCYYIIMDLRLATKVLDLSVNMGPTQAHKLLQRAVDVKVDGILGPKTFAAVNAANAGEVLAKLRLEAKEFYMKLVDDNKAYMPFRKGWLVRAAW